jgi:outer membrane protein TolC
MPIAEISAVSVDDYVALALAQNPQIQAARLRVNAARWQVPQARSLDDPMLGVTVQPAPVQTAAGEQRVILSANQKLPWHGKLDARANRAAALAKQSEAEAHAVELDVIERVKRAYFELYRIDRVKEVVEEQQAILRDLIQIAEARYETGAVSQQDVLRLQVELARQEAELVRLRQTRESVSASLARLLAVPSQTLLLTPDSLNPAELEAELEELQAIALAARPELHGQLAAMAAERRTLMLAELGYYPDVTLGASWIGVDDAGISPVADGQDAVLLSASLNVPLYRKRLDAAVYEARARTVAAARRYDAVRDETTEQVTTFWSEVRSQQDLLALFRDEIIPRSEQAFELSVRAYQVGEVDVLQLLTNMQELLRHEQTVHELTAKSRQSLAALERVLGGALPSGAPRSSHDDVDVESVPVPEPVSVPQVD